MLMAKFLADSGNNVLVITNKMHDEVYEPHKNIKVIFVPPLLLDCTSFVAQQLHQKLRLLKKDKPHSFSILFLIQSQLSFYKNVVFIMITIVIN